MLKLLLDEHISPHVVEGLRRRKPKLHVFCMRIGNMAALLARMMTWCSPKRRHRDSRW